MLQDCMLHAFIANLHSQKVLSILNVSRRKTTDWAEGAQMGGEVSFQNVTF